MGNVVVKQCTAYGIILIFHQFLLKYNVWSDDFELLYKETASVSLTLSHNNDYDFSNLDNFIIWKKRAQYCEHNQVTALLRNLSLFYLVWWCVTKQTTCVQITVLDIWYSNRSLVYFFEPFHDEHTCNWHGHRQEWLLSWK